MCAAPHLQHRVGPRNTDELCHAHTLVNANAVCCSQVQRAPEVDARVGAQVEVAQADVLLEVPLQEHQRPGEEQQAAGPVGPHDLGTGRHVGHGQT